MEFFTKLEPVEYVRIDNRTYKCSDILVAASDMLQTDENASIWRNCLKEYELSAPKDVYQCFVNLGLVRIQIGQQMSKLYCMTSGARKEIESMCEEISAHME